MNVMAQKMRVDFATFSKGTYESNARNEERIIDCPIVDADLAMMFRTVMFS